jgi:hypothetical protein
MCTYVYTLVCTYEGLEATRITGTCILISNSKMVNSRIEVATIEDDQGRASLLENKELL